MTLSHKIIRTLLAAGAALVLPLQFAAAQGPWVQQPYDPDYMGQLTLFNVLALPGPTSVWGVQQKNRFHGSYDDLLVFSDDEGQTWQTKQVSSFNASPNGAFGQAFLGACTTDGLHTWVLRYDYDLKATKLLFTATGPSAIAPLPDPPQDAKIIRFFSNEVGLVLGQPTATATTWPLYRTTDGGASWMAVAAPLPHLADDSHTYNAYPNGRVFVLGNSLWVISSKRQLLSTHDQGLNWQTAPLPGTGKPSSMAFISATNGLLLTDTKELYTTTDGGRTWTMLTPTGSPHFDGVAAVPGTASTYVSFGGKHLNSSTDSGSSISVDGGRSWQKLEDRFLYSAMVASSPNRAWAGMYGSGLLYRAGAGSLVLGSASARPQPAALAYPNPGTGQFRLAPTAHPRQLTLTDALGRQQREFTLPAGATALDLSGCRPGLYVLTSTAQGQTQTQRLVLTAP